MTRSVLTSLSLDGLRLKFAEALGVSKSKVQRSLIPEDPVTVVFWCEETWFDGKAIVELQKVADTIKFQVVISAGQDSNGTARAEMKGQLQVCFYHDVDE